MSSALDQIPGGLADKGPPKDLDPEQLEMGLEVEMEHTVDQDIAREIALDHLTEDSEYYTKLHKMESTGKTAAVTPYLDAWVRGGEG